MKLTVAHALVRLLAAPYTEWDGLERRLVARCFGIFGHDNVAGLGQALPEVPELMTYRLARNGRGIFRPLPLFDRWNRPT